MYPATTEYWHKQKFGKYGLTARCKICRRERDRQYREAHLEELRERVRKYYKDNREARREYNRQWRETNREAKSEYDRHWWKANPDKMRANRRNRRARKRNAEGSHTAVELQEQYKRQKGRCYYCGCKLDKSDYHADHVIPLARGGSDYISNIVCACPVCNLKKHDKLPHEWNGTDRLL